MSTQPEAVLLAALLDYESESPVLAVKYSTAKKAAHELRRLHAINGELLHALRSFPGFSDDATKGDAWIEIMRAAIAKATGGEV